MNTFVRWMKVIQFKFDLWLLMLLSMSCCLLYAISVHHINLKYFSCCIKHALKKSLNVLINLHPTSTLNTLLELTSN